MEIGNKKKSETYDYSIKVRKIYNNRVFSNVQLLGFSDSTYTLVPYNHDNIEKTLSRQGNKAINDNTDKYAKERAFLFAEGFNSVGFESYNADEKSNYDPDSLNNFFSHNTISSFPCCIVSNLGKTIANNENIRHKNTFQSNKHTKSKLRSNNFSYYNVVNDLIAGSYSIKSNNILSAGDIVSVFSESIPSKSFEKLLPLIEKFAYSYRDKHLSFNTLSPHELIFPLFYVLNDFIEFADDNDTLENYLNNDENLLSISRQYNSCEFNEYKHTKKLIESFILPDRVFSLNLISHSSYRRVLVSQSKKSLTVFLNFNSPVQIPQYASSIVISSKIKKVFDSINLMLELELDRSTKNRNDLLLSTFKDNITPINGYYYKTIKEDIEKYYPKKDNVKEELYYKEIKKYTTLFRHLQKEEYDIIVNLIRKAENENIKVDFSHLLIFAYATRYPKTLGHNTGATVLIIIDYMLSKTHYDIDFACDILVHLITNVVFSEINTEDWKTIIEFQKQNNSSISAKHIIRIISREKERNLNQPLHENRLLNDIIDKYTQYRPAIQW